MNIRRKLAAAIAFITGLFILGGVILFSMNDATNEKLSTEGLATPKEASGQAADNSATPLSEAPLLTGSAPSLETDSQAIRKIKRDRLFHYSRSGNFEDTHLILKTALAEGLISEDEYHGELAHMFHLPVSHPHTIISEIIKSGNAYGFEVLVSSLEENHNIAKSMSANERQDVFDQLNKNKPEMVSDMSLLGVGSVSKYTSWVGSLRAFSTEEAFVKNLNDLIENRISDPREAFGLYDILIKKNYSEKISNSAFSKYNYYISTYKNSYPENRMAELVSSGKW